MTAYTPPDLSTTAGIPSQSSDTIGALLASLLSGHEPAVLETDSIVVAASQTIVAHSPVGLDGNSRLIPAVSGSVQAIGLATIDIVTDASTTYKGLPIYRAGCFNPDRIVWPASYDTDAKKFAAFNGAPTPTNIVIRKPKLHAIT